MSDPTHAIFDAVVSAAIAELQGKGVPLYTFAFYHDHESSAVSVCADTEANSARLVRDINQYNLTHFQTAIDAGDLGSASLWQANIGRNLSLGDFAFVNLARRAIPGIAVDDAFYVAMVRAVRARERELVALAPKPERLVFCSSGATDEVGFCWSAKQPAGAA